MPRTGRRPSAEDALEDIEWLLDQGECEAEIVRRMPYKDARSFKRVAAAHGRNDLIARFTNLRTDTRNMDPLGIPPAGKIKSKHYDQKWNRSQ